MAQRVSQEVVETVTTGAPHIRVSQEVVETVTTGAPHIRVSQATVEAISAGAPHGRVSQVVVEVLLPTNYQRVSQAALEKVMTGTPSARVSQTAIEELMTGIPHARSSQLTTEILQRYTIQGQHVTQAYLEALVSVPPIITSVSPNDGLPSGATSVLITGFRFFGVTQVYFGALPATSFIVNSAMSITAVSPPNFSGIVDVRVVALGGTSAIVTTDRFTYLLPPPTITDYSFGTPGNETVFYPFLEG